MEYDIVDLKENEIPYKDAKIYPEFEYRSANYVPAGLSPLDDKAARHIEDRMTFVPIIRDGVKYLIMFRKRFEVPLLDFKESMINSFEKNCISECERMIDKYILDNPIKENKDSFFRIYRYVK